MVVVKNVMTLQDQWMTDSLVELMNVLMMRIFNWMVHVCQRRGVLMVTSKIKLSTWKSKTERHMISLSAYNASHIQDQMKTKQSVRLLNVQSFNT